MGIRLGVAFAMEIEIRRAGLAEWRTYWTVPLVVMAGYSAVALQSYGSSTFVAELENAFIRDISQVILGVTVFSLLGVKFNFIMGRWPIPGITLHQTSNEHLRGQGLIEQLFWPVPRADWLAIVYSYRYHPGMLLAGRVMGAHSEGES